MRTCLGNAAGSVLLVLVLVSQLVRGAYEFDAFRMVQYDEGEEERGSRRTKVDFLAAPASSQDSLSRKIILLRVGEVTADLVKELSERENTDAILVLLPLGLNSEGGSDEWGPGQRQKWLDVENALISSTVMIPVYFAFEDAKLTAMYEQTTSGSEGSDGIQFVVADAAPSPLKQVKVENIQAILSPPPPSIPTDTEARTVLVVAHYDTFGVAPELAVGADLNGSGMVAVLELARMFARLYTAGSQRNGPLPTTHRIVFVLTGGGYLNYHGSRHWVAEAPPALLDSVDFVLCLAGIGALHPDEDRRVFLHATKQPKDDFAVSLFENLGTFAAQRDLELETVLRKVNGSSPQVRWEHEVFAKRKIPAATLSLHRSPRPHFSQGSIVDRRSSVDVATLTTIIEVVGEAIAHVVLGIPTSVLIFSSSLAPNPRFVDAWVDAVSTYPRSAPYTTANFTDSMATALEDVGKFQISRQQFDLEASLSFFDTAKVRMSAHRVKSLLFDVALAAAIGVYLFALNSLIKRFVR